MAMVLSRALQAHSAARSASHNTAGRDVPRQLRGLGGGRAETSKERHGAKAAFFRAAAVRRGRLVRLGKMRAHALLPGDKTHLRFAGPSPLLAPRRNSSLVTWPALRQTRRMTSDWIENEGNERHRLASFAPRGVSVRGLPTVMGCTCPHACGLAILRRGTGQKHQCTMYEVPRSCVLVPTQPTLPQLQGQTPMAEGAGAVRLTGLSPAGEPKGSCPYVLWWYRPLASCLEGTTVHCPPARGS